MNDWLVYIVANTVSPYAFELPLILAYPSGCSYRARFKKEWLEEALLTIIGELPKTRCLIMYRDFESGNLYPIRFGTITAVQTIGEIVYIEYALDSIVAYHNVPAKRQQQLIDFRQEWSNQHPDVAKKNVPRDHMKPLVFRSKYTPAIENPYLTGTTSTKEFESWSNTCDLLSEVSTYANMDFLRVVELTEEYTDKEVQLGRSKFLLSPGKCYKLRIAQRVFRASATVPPRRLNLSCAGGAVQETTQCQMAVGKYDVLTFRLHTLPSRVRGTAVIAIGGEMGSAEAIRLELVCDVTPLFPIRGTVVALVGGLILLFPELVVHLAHLQTGIAEFIPRIGTVLFVLGVMDSRSLFDYVFAD